MNRLKNYVNEVVERMANYGETIDYDSVIDWVDLNEMKRLADDSNIVDSYDEVINNALNSHMVKRLASVDDEDDEALKFIIQYMEQTFPNFEDDMIDFIDNLTIWHFTPEPESYSSYEGYDYEECHYEDVFKVFAKDKIEEFYDKYYDDFLEQFEKYKATHPILKDYDIENLDLEDTIIEEYFSQCISPSEAAEYAESRLNAYKHSFEDI